MDQLAGAIYVDGKWSNHPGLPNSPRVKCSVYSEPGFLTIKMLNFKSPQITIPLEQISECYTENIDGYDCVILEFYSGDYEMTIRLCFYKTGFGRGGLLSGMVKDILRLRADYLKTLRGGMTPQRLE